MGKVSEKPVLIAGAALLGGAVATGQSTSAPWYKRTFRWAKIGTPAGHEQDLAWWRDYWKRLALQGVVIDADDALEPSGTAAGIFRDLVEAAHRDGLAVLASLDSGHVSDAVLRAHPEVVARTENNQPVQLDGGYAVCGNEAFRNTYMAGVLRDVVSRYRVEGIVESNWAGLDRETICYCQSCAGTFRAAAAKELPKAAAWTDPAYQEWLHWRYARALSIWDSGNKITKAAGGTNCLWIGMIPAARALQASNFSDVHEIAKKTPFLLVDNQSRFDGGGFRNNAADGRYLKSLAPSNNVVELMATYPQGHGSFTKVSSPAIESRLWMISGFAGDMQPCLNYPSMSSEDRRSYKMAPPLMQWHKKNEAYLKDRSAVATMGLVWSQSSADVYGRDYATALSELPYRGMLHALDRSNIPFNTIHISDVAREAQRLKVIVLPNVGAMSDQECAVVRRFVENGGTLIATGMTSLCDPSGRERTDFGLADLFGAHLKGGAPDRLFFVRTAPGESTGLMIAVDGGAGRGGRGGAGGRGGGAAAGRGAGGGGRGEGNTSAVGPGTLYVPPAYSGPAMVHTYLRLLPELAAKTNGPHLPDEPPVTGTRHALLAGFEQTDLIPFGGRLTDLAVDQNRSVLCTYVPPFPQTPIEDFWMRQPRTSVPGLIVGNYGKGRVAFLPADLDRRYGMDPIADHGRFLGNILRWAVGENATVSVEGRALVGSHCYQQPGRLILHLLNETGTDNQRSLLDELYPVGPLKIKIKLPAGVKGQTVKLLVAERTVSSRIADGLEFEIPRLVDHEVVVIE